MLLLESQELGDPTHSVKSFDRSTSIATPSQGRFFCQDFKEREILTLVQVSSAAELLQAVATCFLLHL